MSIIIPSADLRNKYPEISRLTKEENKPIFITVNGRGDKVIVSNIALDDAEKLIDQMRDFGFS